MRPTARHDLFSQLTRMPAASSYGSHAHRHMDKQTAMNQAHQLLKGEKADTLSGSMMRQIVIGIVLLLSGAMAWVYTSMPHIIGDGSYDLTVHVSSNLGPPSAVSCEAFSRREHAEFALNDFLPSETKQHSATADPYNGQPLTVSIPVSDRTSMSGRELQRFQFRYLVVLAQMPDGRRVGKLLEIPDAGVAREVSVVLP